MAIIMQILGFFLNYLNQQQYLFIKLFRFRFRFGLVPIHCLHLFHDHLLHLLVLLCSIDSSVWKFHLFCSFLITSKPPSNISVLDELIYFGIILVPQKEGDTFPDTLVEHCAQTSLPIYKFLFHEQRLFYLCYNCIHPRIEIPSLPRSMSDLAFRQDWKHFSIIAFDANREEEIQKETCSVRPVEKGISLADFHPNFPEFWNTGTI